MAEKVKKLNVLLQKQVEKYGEDGLNYLKESQLLDKYIISMKQGGESSAATIKSRLNNLGYYIFKEHTKGAKPLDEFLHTGISNPFELLQSYANYLSAQKTKPNQIRQLVKQAKKFLRVGCEIKIDNEDFIDRVKLPKHHEPEIDGIEKGQIVDMLNACKSIRLKTAIMLAGAMGCRIQEACAVRNQDVDYENSKITFRAEYTKTKVERTRPMTQELKRQLQVWNKVKYRPHENCRLDGTRVFVEPKPEPDDLVLAHWSQSKVDAHGNPSPKPEGITDSLHDEFDVLAETLSIPKKDGRKVISFKSLRAWCKTTISDLGYTDYSEWFIGHSGSTYYRQPEKKRMEIYRKIESYLSFLNTEQLEATQADIASRLEESDRRYQELMKKNNELEARLRSNEAFWLKMPIKSDDIDSYESQLLKQMDKHLESVQKPEVIEAIAIQVANILCARKSLAGQQEVT